MHSSRKFNSTHWFILFLSTSIAYELEQISFCANLECSETGEQVCGIREEGEGFRLKLFNDECHLLRFGCNVTEDKGNRFLYEYKIAIAYKVESFILRTISYVLVIYFVCPNRIKSSSQIVLKRNSPSEWVPTARLITYLTLEKYIEFSTSCFRSLRA